jgi:2-keto-3-deoxy-L-rhamnonate aldolase RhmA
MTALMRPNPVRATLRAGGTAYGTMAFEFFTPGLMAILADAGADFVLLDTEHSGVGIETIKTQIAPRRIRRSRRAAAVIPHRGRRV